MQVWVMIGLWSSRYWRHNRERGWSKWSAYHHNVWRHQTLTKRQCTEQIWDISMLANPISDCLTKRITSWHGIFNLLVSQFHSDPLPQHRQRLQGSEGPSSVTTLDFWKRFGGWQNNATTAGIARDQRVQSLSCKAFYRWTNGIVWFSLDFRHRFFWKKKTLGVLAPSCTHCCPLLASCPSLGGVAVTTVRWIWRMGVKLEIVVLKGGSNLYFWLTQLLQFKPQCVQFVFCMSDINLYCRRFTFWKVTSKLANGVSQFQVFVKFHFFRLHIAKALHHRCHLWLPLPIFPLVPVFPQSGLVLLALLAEFMVASCPMGCGHLESSYGSSVEWQQRWCKTFNVIQICMPKPYQHVHFVHEEWSWRFSHNLMDFLLVIL